MSRFLIVFVCFAAVFAEESQFGEDVMKCADTSNLSREDARALLERDTESLAGDENELKKEEKCFLDCAFRVTGLINENGINESILKTMLSEGKEVEEKDKILDCAAKIRDTGECDVMHKLYNCY